MELNPKYKKIVALGAIIIIVAIVIFSAKARDDHKNTDANPSVQTIAENVSSPKVDGINATVQEENSQQLDAGKTAALPFIFKTDICIARQDQFDCLEKHYAQLVREFDVTVAFDDLKQRYKFSNLVKGQCHAFTHVIGNAAVERYSSVADAYTHGDPFCWSGYYHGVMEGIISKVGRDNITTELPSICAPLLPKGRTSFDYHNCVHGLGHGLMVLTNNELFEALETCDRLGENTDRYSCGTGAFMENIIADGRNHKTKYLKPDQPLYPCTDVPSGHKEACYVGQTSYIYTLTRGDFAKMFETCEKADKGFEHFCFQSVGRDASGQSSSDLINTLTSCNNGRTLEQKQHCSVGAVKDFISYYHSDKQARQLCAGFEEAVQPPCFKTLEEYYKSL